MRVILIALGIGSFSGVIAALCGVGGGLIMVPAFVVFLGLPQKVAVATSLAVIVPTAISATMVNWKNGLVDKQILLWTAIGAVITATYMSTKLRSLSDEMLTKTFAIFTIAMGIRLFFTDGPAKKELKPELPTGAPTANNQPK